jgi:hypothetical protein
MTLLMIGTPSSAVAIPPNTTEPENFEEEHFAKDPTGVPTVTSFVSLFGIVYLM